MFYKKPKSNRVRIFDTTLRDGEQSPGASMTLDEKLAVADYLVKINVDVIEAGFPIASEDDKKAVAEIAKIVPEHIEVAALARVKKDEKGNDLYHNGVATGTDLFEVSIRAYTNALNRMKMYHALKANVKV